MGILKPDGGGWRGMLAAPSDTPIDPPDRLVALALALSGDAPEVWPSPSL